MTRDFLKEGLDLKRLCLVMIRKLWILVIVTLIGLFVGGGIYTILYQNANATTLYQAETEFHISFDTMEFADVVDYYNAYTWGTILIMDPIVEVALEQLSDEITREMIVESVSSEMIGDYRFLTIFFTTADPEISNDIADAYVIAMESFAETIGGLENIEAWRMESATVLEPENYVVNACILGAMIGFFTALFLFLMIYIVDDSIIVPKDVKENLEVPVIGISTKKKNPNFERELVANIKYLEMSKIVEVPENLDFDYAQLREINRFALAVPAGKISIRQLEWIVSQLRLQECRVEGIVLVEVNDILIRQYFGEERRPLI